MYASALQFQVAVDDLRIAVLGRGEYVCSTVSAEIHRVSLSTPVAGFYKTAPSVTVEVNLADGEYSNFETSIGGGMLAPVMYLTPVDAVQAAAFKKALTSASSKRRQ